MKNRQSIKTQLTYKKSPKEGNLRLSRALSMLISERDILEYFNNYKNSRNKCFQRKKNLK